MSRKETRTWHWEIGFASQFSLLQSSLSIGYYFFLCIHSSVYLWVFSVALYFAFVSNYLVKEASIF